MRGPKHLLNDDNTFCQLTAILSLGGHPENGRPAGSHRMATSRDTEADAIGTVFAPPEVHLCDSGLFCRAGNVGTRDLRNVEQQQFRWVGPAVPSRVQPRNFLKWTTSGVSSTPAQLPTSAGVVDVMMARTVERQRPQSDPAPHAFATSLDVVAPFRATSAT